MTPRNTLFVWDFDNTIVLDNTDTLIFRILAPDLLSTLYMTDESPAPWTDLIASGLTTLHSRNIPADRILSAAAAAPLPADTRAALLAIAKSPQTQSMVLSDANSLFISACLSKHDLDGGDVFEGGVVTNPAQIDGYGRIVLKPFLGDGETHRCGRCASNLCKGEVLEERIGGLYQGWRVVYVGDGGNDFCPVQRMGLDDIVLVRKGFNLHKKVEEEGIRAGARIWETAAELKALVEEML